MDAFDGRLLVGEKILWSGQPGQGLRFTARDAIMIPSSLLWGGFAIFWEITALTKPMPLFFALWGVPFVLAGLYVIAGRFLVDAWLRGKIHYAVTTKRILISRSPPFGTFIALRRDQLPDMQLNESADGRGTIRFGLPARNGRNGFASWSPALDPTPQFFAIENVRSVFDQIQNYNPRDA